MSKRFTTAADQHSCVAEDETQRERTADPETDIGLDDGSDLDRGAEAFLDLESDLAEAEEDDLPKKLGYGLVVDAERVDSSAVPADYPWTITSGSAIALTLEHGRTEQTATAYFDWPPKDGDRLSRLLAVAGISDDAFAELHGTQILLTVSNGHVVPFVPPAPPRGSTEGRRIIPAGIGFNLLTLAGVVLGVGVVSTLWFFLVFLVVNLLVIPGGTFLDARHLRSHTDWSQGPSFWALLSAMPFVNIAVSLLYLRSRNATRPIVK